MTVFQHLSGEWLEIISVVAILSMTVGNLFAMRQQNLKRLLGFSSISQIGFVLVGITGNSILGLDSTLYFMLIYVLSNICFFGVLGAVADATGKEDLNSFKGFYRTNPFLALMMGLACSHWRVSLPLPDSSVSYSCWLPRWVTGCIS